MKKMFFAILAAILCFCASVVMAEESVYVDSENRLHIEEYAPDTDKTLLVWISADEEVVYANMFTPEEIKSEIIIPITNYDEYSEIFVEIKGAYSADYTFTYEQTVFDMIYLKELEETGDYEFLNLLSKYDTMIEFSKWNELNSMAQVDQNKVASIILNGSYNNFSELKELMDDAVAEVQEEINSRPAPSRPSESGNRGGGGSVVVVKPAEVVQPVVNNVKTDYFKDLGDFEWAKESINKLYEKGIVNGTSADTFSPEGLLTRGAFIKLLVNTFDCYDKDAVCYFEDISSGDWEYSYVASAYKLGLVNGIDEKNFGAAKAITREDCAVMVFRFLKHFNESNAVSNASETFKDFNDVAGYAQTAVSYMRFSNIMTGTGDNKFSPKLNCNRAMAAKIICNLMEFCR